MSNIKISVLTSIYNHNIKFVRKCLESLKAQTMQEIEFILLDNGANQASKNLIKEFLLLDKRFKVIHIKKNRGLGRALNAGLKEAKGEYIGFVESDDFISPNMYEKLYEQITKFNADVCISGFYVHINGNDEKYNIHTKQIFENSDDTKLFSILDYPFLFTCHQSMWGKLYKSHLLKTIDFSETGKYIDAQFIANVYSSTNKLIALKDCFYYYRFDNPKASNSNKRNDSSLMRILDDWEDTKQILIDNNLYKNLKEEFYFAATKPAYRFYKNILPKYRKTFYNKWRLFTKDLENDKDFSFKYFNNEQKEFLQNVLKENYRGTLKNVSKNKFIEKIFSAKNTQDEKHKIITLLGIKFKFRKKIKTDSTTKIIKHSSDLYFLQKSNIQAASVHPQTFLPYRGVNKDKNIVIVGSGPSLSNYNFIKDYIHIGVNRAFLKKDINLDYLFIQDFLKGKDDMEKANAYNPSTCTKFYGILPENRYNQFKKELKKITSRQIIDANARPYIIEDAACRNWANLLDVEPIGDWCGCIFSALQFALYTAPKKIYLVGCDCSDNGHFHEERAEIEMSSSLSYQYNSWRVFKKHTNKYYPNIEIISINPIGLKGMFKDVYTQSFVDKHPELLEENIEIIDIEEKVEV